MLRAVEFDRLDIIKWLFKEVSSDPAWEFEEGLMDMALVRANVEMMGWLVHHYPKSSVHVSKRCMENQARLGNVAVFQWLCNRGCSIPKSVLHAAISDGHLNVVEYLHESDTGEMWTAAAMDIAASSGHLEIVKFLHQHRHEGCTAGAIDNAASNGHDGVAAFLLLTSPELCSDDMLTEAARTGNAVLTRALCALSNKGCLFDARKAATAAAEGASRKLVVEILNSCISKQVRACSIDKHFRNGTRRCQRADQRRAMLPREHARLHGE